MLLIFFFLSSCICHSIYSCKPFSSIFRRFNSDIYHSLIISNLFHFSWLVQLSLMSCGSACPQVSNFLVYLLGICYNESKHCLLFHLSFSGPFIWFDLLVFPLRRIWTGEYPQLSKSSQLHLSKCSHQIKNL